MISIHYILLILFCFILGTKGFHKLFTKNKHNQISNKFQIENAITDTVSTVLVYRYSINVFDASNVIFNRQEHSGRMYNEIYDFQVDQDHKMHKEWRAMSENPQRADAWFNIPEEELARWGFELIGMAPNKAGTVTLYESNIPHLAYINENVDFRWSHAFAFSHELPPVTLKDLFR